MGARGNFPLPISTPPPPLPPPSLFLFPFTSSSVEPPPPPLLLLPLSPSSLLFCLCQPPTPTPPLSRSVSLSTFVSTCLSMFTRLLIPPPPTHTHLPPWCFASVVSLLPCPHPVVFITPPPPSPPPPPFLCVSGLHQSRADQICSVLFSQPALLECHPFDRDFGSGLLLRYTRFFVLFLFS